jgi:GNAT superfamily N-acetyltransferase
VDFSQVVALVATVSRADGGDIVIGDGRYFADKEGKPERAELGFLIAEPYRGRGIATLLLSHLARIAQQAGLSAFEADVLAYNAPMLAVFERSGLPIVCGTWETLFTSRSLSAPLSLKRLSWRAVSHWRHQRCWVVAVDRKPDALINEGELGRGLNIQPE